MYSLDTCNLWYILMYVPTQVPTQVKVDNIPKYNGCILKLDPY